MAAVKGAPGAEPQVYQYNPWLAASSIPSLAYNPYPQVGVNPSTTQLITYSKEPSI